MEQKKRNPRNWFASLRMSVKIMMSVGILIFCSNLLIMAIVCYTSEDTLKKKIQEQVQNHLALTMATMTNIISQTEELMINMTTTEDIVAFMDIGDTSAEKSLRIVNGVNEDLRFLLRTNKLIDYVAVVKHNNRDSLYTGREIRNPYVFELLLKNEEMSDTRNGDGISTNLMSEVYEETELNMFCPVYSRYTFGEDPKAQLVVGLNTKDIYDAIAGSETSQIRIMDLSGRVLVSADQEEIGEIVEEYTTDFITESGEHEEDDRIVAWQKSTIGGIIVESSMSKYVLLADLYKTILIMILISALFTMIAIVSTYFMCRKFYEPMEEMLKVMSDISEGNLDKKMENYEGEDFRQISQSFNNMTDSLKHQMDMIRQKEQENTEIRLNALHSQIKPHFLYNTLECIHWQALLEGAKEASKMVMALSRYYRLSLSKGAEFVPLAQELEHTKSYIMIQNIRFDNILEMEYDIPEELESMEIPKITLQPLIENAIYHGIKPLDGKKGHVKIAGRLEDGWMILTVEDDGIGMTEEQTKYINDHINVLVNDGSYGVRNVHTRLEIRYGEGSGLHYKRNEKDGITVSVKLPAKRVI